MSSPVITFYPHNASFHWTSPKRATEGSAGYDLYATVNNDDDRSLDFSPHEQLCIGTNISIRIPEGYYGRIAARSGVAFKGFMVNAGVIDRDYSGEIKVLIYNILSKVNTLDTTKAIAQIIIEPCLMTNMILLPKVNTADIFANSRGEGGFGSTDKNSGSGNKHEIEEWYENAISKIPKIKLPCIDCNIAISENSFLRCNSCVSKFVDKKVSKYADEKEAKKAKIDFSGMCSGCNERVIECTCHAYEKLQSSPDFE